MFRKSRDRVGHSTSDAWLLALLQGLAVLNPNIWPRWILT
jgi:hypothetical protein